MIDVKEAVKIAVNFAKEIFPADEVGTVALEEVELSETDPFWYVTLSFTKYVSPGPIDVLSGKRGNQVIKYKKFRIHSETCQVYSVKIRNE